MIFCIGRKFLATLKKINSWVSKRKFNENDTTLKNFKRKLNEIDITYVIGSYKDVLISDWGMFGRRLI